MPMTVEYRNGVQSRTISYSYMVIPEGITNKGFYTPIFLFIISPFVIAILLGIYSKTTVHSLIKHEPSGHGSYIFYKGIYTPIFFIYYFTVCYSNTLRNLLKNNSL